MGFKLKLYLDEKPIVKAKGRDLEEIESIFKDLKIKFKGQKK